MMHEYELAGKGLHTMYVGAIVSLVSVLVVFFAPVLGMIGVLIGGIMNLVGLSQAGPAHGGYQSAMALAVVNIVITILQVFAGPIAGALKLASNIISCAETYYICRASSELLSAKGEYELAGRAEEIWKAVVGCYVVSILCVLLVWIPIVNVIAVLTYIVVAIVSLVVPFMQISFYGKASKALLDE